jgi:hypothetical protein
MAIYLYRTERSIEIVADSEEEADKLVQAELHRGEVILCMEGPMPDLGEDEDEDDDKEDDDAQPAPRS